MATELCVVKHHGAWRIRVDGKHHGYMIEGPRPVTSRLTQCLCRHRTTGCRPPTWLRWCSSWGNGVPALGVRGTRARGQR